MWYIHLRKAVGAFWWVGFVVFSKLEGFFHSGGKGRGWRMIEILLTVLMSEEYYCVTSVENNAVWHMVITRTGNDSRWEFTRTIMTLRNRMTQYICMSLSINETQCNSFELCSTLHILFFVLHTIIVKKNITMH